MWVTTVGGSQPRRVHISSSVRRRAASSQHHCAGSIGQGEATAMAGSSINASRQGHSPGSSLQWSGALPDPLHSLSADRRWVTTVGGSQPQVSGHISSCDSPTRSQFAAPPLRQHRAERGHREGWQQHHRTRDLHPAQAGRSRCSQEKQGKLTFILHRQAGQQAPLPRLRFKAATYTDSGMS